LRCRRRSARSGLASNPRTLAHAFMIRRVLLRHPPSRAE
jgi:hypothetical protein